MSAPVLQSKLPKVETTVFSVMSALAVKHEAINLGQGFPDFDCDPRLVEAVADAMRSGHNQYPLMPGVPLLRERSLPKVEAMYGVRYDRPARSPSPPGATQGILSCISGRCATGRRVIVLEPCYDSYIPNIELAGARAVPIPAARHGDPDFDAIAASRSGRQPQAIIVNNTAQPSGRTWSAADWQRLSDIIGHRDIWVISDGSMNIAHGVRRRAPHQCGARHPCCASVPSSCPRSARHFTSPAGKLVRSVRQRL